MTIREYLAIGRRWWWVLLLGTLLLGGAAYWLTARRAPVYESTAQITVNQIQDPGGPTYSSVLGNQSLTVTYARLAVTATNLGRALQFLNIPGLDLESIEEKVTARAINNTFLIEISARDGDPERAGRIANAVADSLPGFIQEVQLAGGVGQPVNTVFVSDPAIVPEKPLPQHASRNAILGGFLGLILAGGAVVLVEYLNDRIEEPTDLEAFDVPFIGTVPLAKDVGQGADAHVPTIWEDPSSPLAESFRRVQARLTFSLAADPARIIIVTSALSDEGKSTVAVNLAGAIADAGLRVIVVDGDLRRPSVHKRFGLPNNAGLMSAFLAGPKNASSFVATVNDRLGVLTTARNPGSTAKVLASQRMADLLRSLAEDVEVVIVDTPPLVGIADTAHWLSLAEGVILVARRGMTRQGPFQEALSMIYSSGAPLLGVVLNGVPPQALGYYGYEEREEEATSARWSRVRRFSIWGLRRR